MNIIQIRNELQIPETLRQPDTTHRRLEATRSTSQPRSLKEKELFGNVLEILTDDRLANLINEGKVTLGAIKPNAHHGQNLPGTDDEAARYLLAEIGQDRILLSFTLTLSQSQAEEFYAPNRARMQIIPPWNEESYENGWEHLIGVTTSGPITFFLVYNESGQAIGSWRQRMGKNTPSEAGLDTIRGKYGRDELVPNTLVHGSDSTSEVKREVGILATILEAEIR